MIDEVQLYRARIGLRCLRHVKVKSLSYLTIFELFVIMSLVLLQCGDIEINPGPDDDNLVVSFVLSFFPRDVLDEILNLIESVSEDFPSYSWIQVVCQLFQIITTIGKNFQWFTTIFKVLIIN